MATEDAVMAVIKASRPSFRNPHDKIAFALHSAFLASGYTLVATGNPAFSDTVFSSPPSDEVGIEGWNETEDSYGFLYTKNEKGVQKHVLVKCLTMGDCLVIEALSKDQEAKEEPLNLQIDVNDYDGESSSTNYADRYKNFAELVKTLNSDVLNKLDNSPGKKTTSAPASSRSKQSEESRHELQDPEPYPRGFVVPPVLPGHNDDLFPGPGAGMYPRGGLDMGGSMLVGPNDPRWFRPEQPGFPDLAPPGARYDPIGPSGVPGFEPNRFVRNPRRPGTHPDLEHFGNPDFI